MPSISIKRRHKLDHKDAKAAARKVAKDLDKRFGLTHRWKGDEVSFKMKRDGKEFLKAEVVESELPERIDDSEFGQP